MPYESWKVIIEEDVGAGWEVVFEWRYTPTGPGDGEPERRNYAFHVSVSPTSTEGLKSLQRLVASFLETLPARNAGGRWNPSGREIAGRVYRAVSSSKGGAS